MSEMKTVVNRTKKIQVYNIPCPPDCDGKECLCTVQEMRSIQDAKDGERGIRVFDKRLPGSITFLAGEKKNLKAHFLTAPDVKRAIDRGDLRLL